VNRKYCVEKANEKNEKTDRENRVNDSEPLGRLDWVRGEIAGLARTGRRRGDAVEPVGHPREGKKRQRKKGERGEVR
jgi:hypothetical protein